MLWRARFERVAFSTARALAIWEASEFNLAP